MEVRTHRGNEAFPSAAGPLAGIRVLDFTRVLSGPHAAHMLRDMGADVIKVEPPAGDMTRFANPRVGGMSTYFLQQNVGKRNISLDLTKPQSVSVLLDLTRHVDIVIENFRPGVMDRMGLGYAAVAEANPAVIYASITGYGSTGPWRHRRAYASVIGAETGYTKAQCDAHHGVGHPAEYVNDPHSHGDLYTSLECASAILAALFARERSGRGQLVEISMAQTMLYVNEHVHDHLWDGVVSPDWIRSFQPGDYPVLTVANGESVVISGHPAERGTFDRFVGAMGMPELLDDARFASVSLRLEHLDALFDLIRSWALTCPDAHTIERILDDNELAMGVLRTVREIADSDWAAERHSILEVADRNGGTVRVPNAPWSFSESGVTVGGQVQFRGEDNDAVLRELLNLDEAAITMLYDSGVLSSRIPHPKQEL
jgi:crotonobetainyl-CoA:carnitine CoA-transferase CaiB-like acyl-CoA transferase